MNFKAIAIIALLNAPLILAAQTQLTRTTNVNKSFKVNPDCNVEITNKYGNVHVFPWSKDSVSIDIVFTARATSEEKLNKIISLIDFEFTNTKYYVVANTYFKDYTNRIWTDITNIAGTLFSSGTSVEINYAVHLPVGSHLKIDNKFGNVYTTNHEGSLNLNLSNGDFKANDLKGDTKIKISFGNGSVHSISKGTLSINYAEFFDIQEAGTLVFDTRSSRINIGQAKSLQLTSRRDKFTIQNVNDLSGNCSFSYINVFGLGLTAELDSKYGSTSVQGINKNFKYLGLISSFTDINLYFGVEQEYKMELKHDKKTILSLPSSYNTFKTELINPDEGVMLVTGQVGNTPTGRVRIDSKSGSVTIIQK